MDNNKLQILIKKTVTPRAKISALSMGLGAVEKADRESAPLFFAAVLELDVYKAALLSARRPEPFASDYRRAVLDRLAIPDGDFTEKELLAALELSAGELFSSNAQYINEKLLREAFADSELTVTASCRLMRYCIENTEKEIILVCEELFCEALSRYDSSAEEELRLLLPELLSAGCVAAVSRLILTLSAERLNTLYEGFFEGIYSLLAEGQEATELWDAYFGLLFAKTQDIDELLCDGLWFMTMFSSEENYPRIAPLFFLHAAENLDIDHELFDYADYEGAPVNCSRSFVLRLERILEERRHNGGLFCKTLKRLEICNPYAAPNIDETHVRDNQKEALLASAEVTRLFENGFSGEEVLYAFFNTDLKRRLALEDLLLIAKRFEKFDTIMSILTQREFTGTVKSINRGKFLLQPNCYCVLALYPMRLGYAFIEQLSGDGRDIDLQRLEGKTLSYKITGFSDNEITVEVLSQNIEVENNESNWEAAVEWLRNKAPKHSNAEMPQHLKNVLLDCLVDSFINDGLLEDITQTINENPQSLSTYLALFIKAKWNSAFVSPEHALEAQFFGKLKKHKESSLALFRSLFASGVSAEEIVNFYMKTIYKAIVPFDLLLAMDNKETMLSALSNQAIFCRLREGEKRAQGRLVNICSSPVCNVSGVENYHDYATVRTTVSDFFTINGSVFRINLKIAARESLTREERGELFAYFSRNIEVNNSRRRFAERFPDSAVYDIREMSFNMKCLEEAVWLRRFNDDALLDLISILGDKNLFRFRASAREEACYLHLCMRDTEPSTVLNLAEQIILNASSSSDVSDIYLNTHIKFFIHIPQLLTLISARNAALCRSEGDMFGGRVFLGAVSERGMLWSPYLPQGIMVDERYKNSAVEFSVSVDRGTASVSVLKEADPREGLFEVIKLLRMGRALNEEIKPFIKRALSGYEKLSVDTLNDAERFLQEGIKALIRDEAERRRKPNLARHKAEVEAFIAAQKREPQPPQEYGEKIARYVERCRFSVSLEDMEELLSSLSEELIKTLSFEEFTEFYMMVFPNYSYNFRDNGLVHIWERQIAEHYGEAAACEFMERMKQNKRYKKNC